MTQAFNWAALYPEIVLLVMACVVMLADLGVREPRRRLTYGLTLVTLAVVAGMHLAYFRNGDAQLAMGGMFVGDTLGHLLAFFATLAVAATLVYARDYAAERDMLKGELYSLTLFVLLGISVMVAANNLLIVYVGLEVMSLSLYALVALRRDDGRATEAAMKYFVLGALASGFMLYGMSMVYGATGSLDLGQIYHFIDEGNGWRQLLVFGLVFIVAGLAFKLGAVPFHMWVPDVYHGAPTAVTLLVASAPKLAAFGIALRLLVVALLGLAVEWQQMLVVLAVASLLIGNLAAIAQTNLKRMLAYSAIAQIGFMLLALTVGVVHNNTVSAAGAYSAALFYLVTYILTTLGTFGLIMLLARQGFEAEDLRDLSGLNRRSPLMAAVMAVFMLSLAGIPPTAGFDGKLAVLQALISTNLPMNVGLAVFAVLISLVAAYYYLRVIKVMYFDAPVRQDPITCSASRNLLALNGAAVLLLGVLPGGLMAMCARAIVQALGS